MIDVLDPIRRAVESPVFVASMAELRRATVRLHEAVASSCGPTTGISGGSGLRGYTMDAETKYEEPKVERVGNLNDLLSAVPEPKQEEPKPPPARAAIPDLVGTRWRWSSRYLPEKTAIAAGHMLPDTFGGVTRDLDGNEVQLHRRAPDAVLEVVRQEVIPNPFDATYPRLQALLVQQATGWRRVFVFSLVQQSDGALVPACPALSVGHDRADPYAIGRDGWCCCVACGDEPGDGLCRETGWRQRAETLMAVQEALAPPVAASRRAELPVMDVVGGAGARALVCGGL